MVSLVDSVIIEDSGAYKFADVGSPGHHKYNLPKIQSFIPKGLHTIMDAGCGAGQVSNWLAGLGHNVWGCDYSESGVALAKEAFPRANFFVGDLMEGATVPDGMDTFDGIVSVEVVEHLFDPEKALTNINASLKPGGFLILTTPYHGYVKNMVLSLTNKWDDHFMVDSPGGHIKFFSPRTIKIMLEETGFTDIQVKGAGRGPLLWCSMVVFARKA